MFIHATSLQAKGELESPDPIDHEEKIAFFGIKEGLGRKGGAGSVC